MRQGLPDLNGPCDWRAQFHAFPPPFRSWPIIGWQPTPILLLHCNQWHIGCLRTVDGYPSVQFSDGCCEATWLRPFKLEDYESLIDELRKAT